MLNLHGSLYSLRALVRPGLIVPGIKVDTIARLDFAALKSAGYTAAVFDRDNCLTIPHRDEIVPDIADAWARCKSTFGPSNVLIVSNSAGTGDDPLGIQAESLAFNLGVPVLRHSKKKPACGDDIVRYFQRRPVYPTPVTSRSTSQSDQSAPSRSPDPPDLNEPLVPDLYTSTATHKPTQSPLHAAPAPRLLIIGDRLMTDILLASTLPSKDHLGIWTTHLWSTPDLSLLRFLEKSLLRLVLWSRNLTFRNGVLEKRARGETWLGREGWLWKMRRVVLGAIKRVKVESEVIPPRTNQLARFVVPLMPKAVAPSPPTTRAGWAWYYAKIVGRYTGKGMWIGALWTWMRARQAARRGWIWSVARFKEAKAKRTASHTSIQTKA